MTTTLAWTHVGPEPIDPAHVIARVTGSGVGGITTFIGTVRDLSDGRAVDGIEYEAYVEMAARELASIAAQASEQHAGVSIAAEHRTGVLSVGDVAVVVAAGHAHRAPAFDACRFAIEEIKRRLPIWKREQYTDGSRAWVEPTAIAQES